MVVSALLKPTWLYHLLTKPKWKMANMVEHLPHGGDALKAIDTVNAQFRADVDWDDERI